MLWVLLLLLAAPSAAWAANGCDGYLVSNAGNASINGCYARVKQQLFGAPYFVKDEYSWLFKYCGKGCPFSTEVWRLGMIVPDGSATCTPSNASCWTLKQAYYTMGCATPNPAQDGWLAWGYNHNTSLPKVQGSKLSPSCGHAQPPGPSPPGPSPGPPCGYTAGADTAGTRSFWWSQQQQQQQQQEKDASVPWGSNCTCVPKTGTTTCRTVDMAQESSPARCTPDLRSIPADLTRPVMRTDLHEPVPGSRIKQTHPDFAHTAAYHALYLPPQWKKGSRVKLPVLVEYAGNGPWAGSPGVGDGHWADPDVSTGRPEDMNMGYGISGGNGFIWIAMPLLTADLGLHTNISTYWWGCNSTEAFVHGPCGTYDITPTIEYTKKTVAWVIEQYGGDPDNVFAMGWSRGAIAATYIGLHDDEIAKLWAGFIPFSHIDGMIPWGYPGSDVASAKARYARATGKHFLVTAECDIATNCEQQFLAQSGITALANFSFVNSGFRNHNDQWLLRPSVGRIRIRRWLRDVMGLAPQLPECTPGQLPPYCSCTLRCPGGCCTATDATSAIPPTCTRETLRDDFDGDTLNSSLWVALDQIHRGGLYHPSNVAVHDGKLWMKTAPANYSMAEQLWFMSSGAVNSSNRFQQQYGVFEVKAMPYYCPHHVGENASKPYAFISHNTFWMYGFVEHPTGAQAATCNCPEEFDVWEMGGQNWHITGDERQNKYTNKSAYCASCTGPFRRSNDRYATAGNLSAAAVTPASCPGGYIVAGAGTSELNGCYLPAATPFRSTPRYMLQGGGSGVYTNASLFLYPAEAADTNPKHWLWRIGTLVEDQKSGELTLHSAFYSSACASAKPMMYGWTIWGGGVSGPPPLLHAGAGEQLGGTCPPPAEAPPGPSSETGGNCSTLQMQTYTLEWREHYARMYVDGELKSEYNAATFADEAAFNYYGKYNDDIIYGATGPGHTAIEWIQQPLFMSFTSCIMNNVPLPSSGADDSPMYFVVDSVRVCE